MVADLLEVDNDMLSQLRPSIRQRLASDLGRSTATLETDDGQPGAGGESDLAWVAVRFPVIVLITLFPTGRPITRRGH